MTWQFDSRLEHASTVPARYYIDPAAGTHHLRLTFSFAPPEALEKAVAILGDVIRELDR